MAKKILKLGIPKGSLQNATFELLNKAGFGVSESERSYFPRIDDEQIRLIMLRAQIRRRGRPRGGRHRVRLESRTRL